MRYTNWTYKLAIIIPCWNSEEFIGELIEAILSQTFTDWKAFFIDDNCTDRTADVIKQYTSKDHRLIYKMRDREPKGAPTCRNIGFDLSEGAEFVCFLDSDDLIAPYCLSQRVSYMENNPEIEVATFPMKTFVEDIWEANCMVYGKKFHNDSLEAILNWSLPFVAVTNIYRRDSLIKHSINWDENLKSLQDSDYSIQTLLSDINHTYAEESEYDYFYRSSNNGIASKIRTEAHFISHIYLINKTLNSVEKNRGNKYDDILCSNVVNYFDHFGTKRKYYYKILRMKWIIKHPLFFFKILIYVISNFHMKYRLFSKEINHRSTIDKKWNLYIKNERKNF